MSKQYKIIIVGPAYPYRGGNSLFVSHLYDLLKEEFSVTIYNYKLLYPSFLFPGTTQYDKSNQTIKKAPSKRIVNSVNPFNWIVTAKKIHNEKADLILFDWWHPFFGPCHFTISYFLRNRYKGRIVFITENFISHEGNFVDKFLTRLGLQNADVFLTLSEKVAGELASLKGNRKVLKSELPVYDCYSLKNELKNTKKEFGYSNDDKVLLFFGYIRRYKGLDVLIDAMKILVEGDNNYKLLIVGESYEDINIYRTQIQSLSLDSNITLINSFVPNEEVEKYYSACDLVVLPYREATQSGILNIAYGFNKPVVVTDVGGLKEFVEEGKTGYMVKAEDKFSLAEGIRKYFRERDSIPFSENISAKISRNKFHEIPAMLKDLLKNQ